MGDDLEAEHSYGSAKKGPSSRLQIDVPKSLTKPGGYRHREAFFGIPPYGGSIQQKLYFATSNMCEYDSKQPWKGYPNDTDRPKSPFVLMIERGGCSFVQKARNAQKAGAAGVVFADDMCTCEDLENGTCHEEEQNGMDMDCEEREPIMADDGSGADVTIPSLLLYKQDADDIKKELLQNHMVRLEMAWSLPSTDTIVSYDLWTTPTEALSKQFQKQFRAAAEALGEHAHFTPHMYLYNGIDEGCRDAQDEDVCDSLCSSNGRYCSADPDGDLDSGISGFDVVRESLRRDCIWRIYGFINGVGEEWWKYVENFLQHCDTVDNFANLDCVTTAMAAAGIDPKEVAKCETQSGGLDSKEVPNKLLDQSLKEKDQAGVVVLPTAYVNGIPLRGELEFATVFKGVCDGYARGSEPKICTQCAKCGIDEYTCVVQGGVCPVTAGTMASASGSVSTQTFAISMGVMAVLFVLFLCVGLICLKRHSMQMRRQVAGMMAKYKPIDASAREEMNGMMEGDEDYEQGNFT